MEGDPAGCNLGVSWGDEVPDLRSACRGQYVSPLRPAAIDTAVTTVL